MTTTRQDERGKAFTLTELIIILAVVCVLAMLLAPALLRAKHRSQRIGCTCRLKQIGLASKTWALDHTNLYPVQVAVAHGGSMERMTSGAAFCFFQVMSNELSTPTVLTCPADTRRPVKDFARLTNSNLSYFVNISVDDAHPEMVMAGDRNLTNGSPAVNGLLTLSTNRPAGWTHELHNGYGQVLLTDGSVQQLSAATLRLAFQGSEGSRLAIP